jgi:hypothetical protein
LNNVPIPNANGPELTVTNFQPQDQGEYAIIVSNAIESVTTPVATVLLEPTLVTLVESRFESGTEGWGLIEDATDLRWVPTGGNGGGGHLLATDLALYRYWYWVAPAKFLGDQSRAYRGWLQFDLQQSVTVAQSYELVYDLILEGAGRTLRFAGLTHPGTTWTSYKLPLAETRGWQRATDSQPPTAAEMQQVLGNLTNLLIRGEFSFANDIGGLDNVALLNACATTPAPLSLRLLPSAPIAVLEWPAHALCFEVEATADVASPSWAPPVTVLFSGLSNGMNRVEVPLTGRSQFFRLKRQ